MSFKKLTAVFLIISALLATAYTARALAIPTTSFMEYEVRYGTTSCPLELAGSERIWCDLPVTFESWRIQ